MTSAQSYSPLPAPSPDHLQAIAPGLPVLAFLAVSGHGSSARDAVEKALLPLYADPSLFGAALSQLAEDRLITLSKAGRCRITDAGRKRAEDEVGKLLGRGWPEIVSRGLASLALGMDPKSEDAQGYLARKDNLECAALARLYGMTELGETPSRSQVRFALLRAVIIARLPECEPAFTETMMHNTSRDAMGRTLLLGAAGLQRGTIRDAEAVLLRRALGLRPEASGGVAEALIRSAIGKTVQRATMVPAKKEIRVEKADLTDFAATVRSLAKTLRTDPFAGRVAIAQVYDAGMMRGLSFGMLDEFKSRVAEACRAGLLDLERYDIAGPMDSALRDRSRTIFGRDERHFIVNEWI
jgi:hypothetical protein